MQHVKLQVISGPPRSDRLQRYSLQLRVLPGRCQQRFEGKHTPRVSQPQARTLGSPQLPFSSFSLPQLARFS